MSSNNQDYEKKSFLLCVGIVLLLFFNQFVFSQYPIAPDKSVRDDTENITADDLKKTQNIFSQSELGIQTLLEPSVITTINFDDITIFQENSIQISPNRYAGVSFYSTPVTATWLTRFQSYSYPNSLVVGTISGFPNYEIYSANNINIDFAQPAKDVAFVWGRNGNYNPGQIQIYDNNNQLISTLPVNFGIYTWVGISLNSISQRIKKLILLRPSVPDARYGHIFIDNFQFQPNPFISPVGSLNSVSTTTPAGAIGWSVDPDNPSASNNVDCYVDGILGQGRFIGRVLANTPSPPGVPYPGNHGFFTPIPTDLRDGNQHQMYCYGIDIIGGAVPTLLTGSPKAFTWNPDSTVEFSNLPSIVETNGEGTLKVTVRNLPNPNDTTRLTFRTTNGTAVAKFLSNSGQYVDELVITGNVTNQAVRILGITESSQANNIIVEARFGNTTTVRATRTFTIATITSLVFEKFDTTYTDLDDNGQPLTISQRIFPDKNDSADQTDRSLVKVKATILPAIPNVQIYFANFDMDDPSANDSPIDTNGYFGNDNNGSVMIGATTSSAGQLSFFSMPTGCSATVGKANCVTGADGTLTVKFKTTMQPGDNFVIAASLSEIYRDEFHAYPSNDLAILNRQDIEIPISGEINDDLVAGIRTKMLTVWRRLHIEVDSMGVVQDNFVQGTIPNKVNVSRNVIATITVSPTPNNPLEVNRFENGRIIIGNRPSFRIIDSDINATPRINANTANTVTIDNTGGTSFSIAANEAFTLYDDDDFNDNDGTLVDGDDGSNEDVSKPNTDLLQSSDTACNVGDYGKVTNICNVLLPAYVVPKYDLSGSNENIPFSLNIEETDFSMIFMNHFNNRATEGRADFWTVYMLGAYQYNTREDSDPDESAAEWGRVDELDGNGLGLVSFAELHRATEFEDLDRIPIVGIDVWRNRPVDSKYTTAHELGHLFDGRHEDCLDSTGDPGVMRTPSFIKTGIYCNETINKIRGGTGILHP